MTVPTPVTLRADVAEGLAQEGMRATAKIVGKPGRIEQVCDGLIYMRRIPFAPPSITLHLLDPLTLCAITAWVASRLLGEEGRVFGPDEVFCIFDRRDGQWPTLTIGLVGARRSATIDDLGVVAITGQPWRGSDDALVGIFDHVSPSLAGTRLGRALALKAAVEAIAARDLRR